ncbi:hypothetical protein [Carbonactinospora thermoautotrophica]|uniref:hypothetical protein n=1 Tax=Carbonactinospora thermoautotrophica TaxID=1469144 RepID=UPI000A7AD97B|nr:hypothetical protein [Carbonactinospora thermoautotrophica]
MVTIFTQSSLYAGARKFAHSALHAYADEDWDVFVLHAGTSLELLGKAALVKRSPVLLVELGTKDISSLAHLCGVRTTPRPRTIGLAEVLNHLTKLGVNLRAADADLKLLVDLRNGVVHAGGGSEGSHLLVAYTTAVEALIVDLAEDRKKFWDAYLRMIDTALSDAANEVAHRVQVKLEAARVNFNKKFLSLPEPVRNGALAFLIAGQIASGQEQDDVEEVQCPVCTYNARAYGYHRPVSFSNVDYEHDEVYEEGWVEFEVHSIECSFCGLKLEGAAELEVAGIDSVIETDRDANEFLNCEPDEDSFWDR